MTETLIAELAKLPEVRVISRTSVMSFRNREQPIIEIARLLNVDGIIEGSVMRSGDNVRITTQLIDARDDRHLWAEQYDREIARVFEIQSEVAKDVAKQIALSLSPEQAERLKAPGPIDPRAQDAYLKSIKLGDDLRSNYLDVQSALEECLMYASDFTPAWAALSYLHYWASVSMPNENRSFRLVRSRRAAERAIELDGESGDAWMALGRAKLRQFEFEEARAAMEKGIQLGVHDPRIEAGYPLLLTIYHQGDKAKDEFNRITAKAPLDPELHVQAALAYGLSAANTADGERELQAALRLNPNHRTAIQQLQRYAEHRSDFAGALAAMEVNAKVDPYWTSIYPTAAEAYSAEGEQGYWRAMAEATRGSSSGYRVRALIRSGKTDAALDLIEQWFEDESLPLLTQIGVDQDYDSIRNHPRFIALTRRMNLPQPPQS